MTLQQNYLKESCFTLKTLERLKQFNQGTGAELFMILGGHLDTDLQVLSNVVCEHGTKTLQWIFHRQRTKMVDKPLREENRSYKKSSHKNWGNCTSNCTGHCKFYLGIKKMCVDNCSLDVKYVCVVLQCLKRETSKYVITIFHLFVN